MRRKKQQGEQAQASGDGRLTPAEIQQVEFRLAFRGYNERDVDAFLDRITEDLSIYIEENQRLRSGAGLPASAGAPSASAGGINARAAIAPFLNREREFLQTLGGLVQGHAQEIKGMVLAVRAKTEAEAPVDTTAVDAADPEPQPSERSEPEPEPERSRAAGPPLAPPADPVVLDAGDESGRPAVPKSVPAESVSADRTSGERSLRDLFWGED